MPYVKDDKYRDIPFSKQTPHSDFYVFSNVGELASKSLQSRDEIIKCRTIGILQSNKGKFFLTDLKTPLLNKSEPLVRVSMRYLKSPVQSTLIPYPVQIFGTLQWRNRPVIYTKILQVLKIPIALRLQDILSTVVNSHRANTQDCDDEN